MKKLNIGCGNDIKEGFVNVDIRKTDPRVLVCDIRKLPFKDEEFDYIYAKDIIEHVGRLEVHDVLKEWARVLKKGGEIFIMTPNLKTIAQAYLDGRIDAREASRLMFGQQDYKYNYHYFIFDERWVREELEKVGLLVKSVRSVSIQNMQIISVKK